MSVPGQVKPACPPGLQYDALPNTTLTRILDIVESSPTESRCGMRVVDLGRNLTYVALYYTWDNPITVYERPLSDPVTLKHLEDPDKFKFPFARSIRPAGLDGEDFAVPDGARREYYSSARRVIEAKGCPALVGDNSFHVLLSIGEPRRHTSGETLDAAEVVEARDALKFPSGSTRFASASTTPAKGPREVQLMGRIFKSTVHVFAWTGPTGKLENEATEAIGILLYYKQARSRGMGRYLELTTSTLSRVLDMTATHWFALFAFLQRRWFRSAWVAQEITLARHTYIVHGETILDMSLIVICALP